MLNHPLELLSPARDLECGLAAINHGADAVYIGAPRFGARAAAANSVQDIEKLVQHAHLFHARVYVALNTLLGDEEIEPAVQLIRQLYDAGIDALIIQDMGLLECDLPPLPLHASTQVNNRTPEKVKFLQDVGFQQVVLARELSLEQIRAIRQVTTIPLECFIHGALCVSYSGQCYISERVGGRSGNRGECAQFCRHKYTLRDRDGKVIAADKYLLSIRDLDLSAHLEKLLDAGISSFKIEGRLKGSDYVKNVTAFYRKALDAVLETQAGRRKLSSGNCRFSFSPDTSKSFNRGKCDYFLTRTYPRIGAIDSPKSIGEKVGTVITSRRFLFRLDSNVRLNNGDGLCYFNRKGELTGLTANRVEGSTVHHRSDQSPQAGTVVYRNQDTAFQKLLSKSNRCRFIMVTMRLKETVEGYRVEIVDEDCCRSHTSVMVVKEPAAQPGGLAERFTKQLKKSGGTVFTVESVETEIDETMHVPAAVMNELRRKALANHEVARRGAYMRQQVVLVPNETPWISESVTFLDNITNSRSRAFYQRHGATADERDASATNAEKDKALMRTKYCIRNQLGMCTRKADSGGSESFVEPFTIEDNTGVYTLEFDCECCEMVVKRSG